MDEARELRDTLEKAQAELRRTRSHLDKLRAHQARERESLQQEVEAARREVAELRARLEAPPAPPRPAAAPVQPPPSPVAPSLVASSALVALVRKPEPLEDSLPVLSRLLGVSAADLRLRLAAPAPSVLVQVPASEAEALRAALQAEGFVAVSCEVRPRNAAGLMLVRRFTLDAQGLQLEGPRGERQQLPYAELRLLVRGRRTSTTVTKSVEWVSPEDRGATRMGRRGSWQLPELKHSEVKENHHSQFLWAYGEGARVAFSERTLFSAQGLRQGTSLAESLQRLGMALRERAPQVVWDERLLGMPRFSLPLVDPGRGHELFAELLFQAVRQGVGP